MARYYEADKLLEYVEFFTPPINGETTMQCVKTAIRYAPTADVAEVKHGKWVQDKYITQKCSFCGFEIDDDVSFEMYDDCYRKPKYCPECGAKMECETE